MHSGSEYSKKMVQNVLENIKNYILIIIRFNILTMLSCFNYILFSHWSG